MPNNTEPRDKEQRQQLSVRLTTELVTRVSIAAAGAGKSVTQFVQEALDERTKEHKDDAARIIEREKIPKQWSLK